MIKALLPAALPGVARLQLSRAKHRSLAGHVRLAKRVAGQLPAAHVSEAELVRLDGAPDAVVRQRAAGFAQLSDALRAPVKTLALTAAARQNLSDLQFTGRYRVPFPFSRLAADALPVGAFLDRSEGPRLTDLDGRALLDLTGSYGVNVLGYEAYKALIAEGTANVAALGPVLGQYHPLVEDTAARIVALSGLDEVSFHMSGTEAVMQAVRLAQYHTGRGRIVRFAGAYHGWWGDVQPGLGNPVPAPRTLTLAELSDRTLAVIRSRRDIACVLVNPLQALHSNRPAPSDGQLVDGLREAGVDRARYAAWLRELRAACDASGTVLILDEVFTGFRLARGGAAEYFGLRADLVTYGKTLGGGLPIGVLAGRHALMRRFREERPADINFARGTFNAHPYVIGAAAAFLRRLDTPETQALYAGLDARWADRADALNARLAALDAPLRVAALSSIWTVTFHRPSRFNWLLQYYLRVHGLALSWVGTGRIIWSFDYDDALFADACERFVAGVAAMTADGWWWDSGEAARDIRRDLLRTALRARFGRNR